MVNDRISVKLKTKNWRKKKYMKEEQRRKIGGEVGWNEECYWYKRILMIIDLIQCISKRYNIGKGMQQNEISPCSNVRVKTWNILPLTVTLTSTDAIRLCWCCITLWECQIKIQFNHLILCCIHNFPTMKLGSRIFNEVRLELTD